jgi:hypothetical protein
LITVDPALDGGVKLIRVLASEIATLPEPDVMDAEVIVLPVGAYAKVERSVSKGSIDTVDPATAVRVSGQAASGTKVTSSRKFPAVLEIAELTDSKANLVIVCSSGTE